MATTENNTAETDPDHNEKIFSLSEDDATAVLHETAPLNFSALTPAQLGISVHSFSLVSSNRKGEKTDAEMLYAVMLVSSVGFIH